MKEPFIEVIIVFKDTDNFVLESVKNCLSLDHKNFSILLVPDNKIDFPVKNKKIRIARPSGPVSIAKKRNLGIKSASKKAEFIAFIDSDAFPRKDWLKNAIKYFKNNVIAVGGPNLTPQNDEFKRKITGNVI